jgi:Trk K+ transport system NAD-binding subunit
MSIVNRREFLKGTAWMGAAAAISGCHINRFGFGEGGIMQNYAFEKLKGRRIRVGFIGIGGRGTGAVHRVSMIPGVDVVALCDLKADRVEANLDWLRKRNYPGVDKIRKYVGPEAYKELCDFGECDVVVVAIGTNVEASIMATANCKEMGISSVVAKASNELHGRILRRIGADSVVYPDRDSAHRLARAIANHNVVDFLEVSEGYSIAEIDVPEDMRGKTLAESDFRRRTGLSVLCIRRAGEDAKKPRTVIMPQASDVLEADDRLIVFGQTRRLDEVSS